jgi:hypothetical protein
MNSGRVRTPRLGGTTITKGTGSRSRLAFIAMPGASSSSVWPSGAAPAT